MSANNNSLENDNSIFHLAQIYNPIVVKQMSLVLFTDLINN